MMTKKDLMGRIETMAVGTSYENMIPFLGSMKKEDLLVINQKVSAEVENIPQLQPRAEIKSPGFTSAKEFKVEVMKAIYITCSVLGKKLVSKKTIKEALFDNKIDLEYKEIEAVLDLLIKDKTVSYMRNAESRIPFFGLTAHGKEVLKKNW